MGAAVGDLGADRICTGDQMTRYTFQTYFVWDGDTEEDIVVEFTYTPPFCGTQEDPPHDADIEVAEVHRCDWEGKYPWGKETTTAAEFDQVQRSDRIREECLYHANEERHDALEAIAEFRREMREDR